MKRPLILVLVASALVVVSPPAPAQDVKPSLTVPEMKASIANLEAHIEDREERLNDLADDIISLDARVEEGIDDLVELLASVGDSEESKTRVSNVKEEAIAGLGRMIEFYRQKRAGVREQLRTGKTDVPLDTLEKDVNAFDDRIQKRVEQIVTLTESFTRHEDFDKYVVTGTSTNWRGWGWENEEISEAWKQNRRDVHKTEQNRKEVIGALEKNLEDLQQRQSYLRERLRTGNLSETERQLYTSDISRIDGILSARQAQLEDLTSSDEQPDTRKVDRDQAYDVGRVLEDAKTDLRSDFYAIFSKYDELNRVRGQIATMKENLEARKEFLAEHGGK